MADDKRPSFTESRCFRAFLLCNFFTPLDTQAYNPILPLQLRLELGAPYTTVGYVFSTLTFSSMLSFVIMPKLCKQFSTRQILLGDFMVRFVSGAIYVFAMVLPIGHWLALPLIYLSRFLFGITLNSFAFPPAWIGVRCPQEQKQQKVMLAQMALSLGIVFGPSWGSLMAAFLPTRYGYGARAAIADMAHADPRPLHRAPPRGISRVADRPEPRRPTPCLAAPLPHVLHAPRCVRPPSRLSHAWSCTRRLPFAFLASHPRLHLQPRRASTQ